MLKVNQLGLATRPADEFALHHLGIQTVEHEYVYAVNMADEKTLKGYLERAYLLGKEFTVSAIISSPERRTA